MDMQCDILISNLKNPKTIALMKENIENMSDGSSPHCASALKLGFKKAFELKKRKISVQLRCSNDDCEWHDSPVSHSSIGSNTYCPNCNRNPRNRRGRYYRQCTGCESPRSGSYESCQSCGKRFI